jgi:hypothetical protein
MKQTLSPPMRRGSGTALCRRTHLPQNTAIDSRDSHLKATRAISLPAVTKRNVGDGEFHIVVMECADAKTARMLQMKNAPAMPTRWSYTKGEEKDYFAPIALMRALRREMRREAVFFGSAPLPAPRAISGCASFSAALAAF